MFGAFLQFQFRSTKLMPVLAISAAKILALLFFQTNTPNQPRWTQNSCLVHFHSFGFGRQVSFETRPRGAVLATSGAKIHAVLFFEMNATNQPRFTQNSCLVRFGSFSFVQQNSCEICPQGAVLPTSGAKIPAVDFFEMHTPNHPRLTQN
jgi:hypothetical protein